jgi:hypothetical protein
MNAAGPARRRHARPWLAPSLVVLVLAAGGCGSTGAGSTGAGGRAEPAPQSSGQKAADSAALGSTGSAAEVRSDVQQRAVISTGQIELSTGDVPATRTRLDEVLAREGGHVADENTVTDQKGTVTRSHLVVRVPGERFDDTMTSLGRIASLRSSSRKAEDVTTRVIDLQARIVSERAGVRRLRRLVSQTADLRALLDVERALTERQGELQSMKQQRVYLDDQTTRATITVDIVRQTAPAPVAHAAGGFVGGLQHGWHGLVSLVVALLLVLGAVLPFAAALTLVGAPTWLVVRRLRRTRRLRAPAES